MALTINWRKLFGAAAKGALGASSGGAGVWIKLIAGVVALLAAAALGAFLTRTLFHGSQVQAEQTVSQLGQQAQVTADSAIQREVITRYEEHRVIEEQVREGIANVDAVETTATMDPELAAAGVDALCMHDSYRAVNGCPMSATGPAEKED